MTSIRLPLDTKSLYFNIKNDNLSGHTATVATPLTKKVGFDKLEDVFLLEKKEIDISAKTDLISLLVKHSKSKVLIKKLFVFDKIAVNGEIIQTSCSFGMYVKEEIDESKYQFGRLKLHYPSKLIYEDEDLKINNKEIYKEISNKLNNYAFLVRALEYNFETDVLNFDVLIVGENDIPYSKVFINEKGSGNKFNVIFNEIADDYDNEIILLRKHFGLDVNPNNYLDYLKMIKNQALSFISEKLNIAIENISVDFPYSLFDFIYTQGNVKKYGILRVTTTRNKYFNLSIAQKMFLANMNDKCSVFLVSQALDNPLLTIYDCSDLDNLSISINSMKFREENL